VCSPVLCAIILGAAVVDILPISQNASSIGVRIYLLQNADRLEIRFDRPAAANRVGHFPKSFPTFSFCSFRLSPFPNLPKLANSKFHRTRRTPSPQSSCQLIPLTNSVND
jgi:hypothetical protein